MGADWRKRASYEYDAGLADRRGTHPLVGSDPSCRHRHPKLPHSRTRGSPARWRSASEASALMPSVRLCRAREEDRVFGLQIVY